MIRFTSYRKYLPWALIAILSVVFVIDRRENNVTLDDPISSKLTKVEHPVFMPETGNGVSIDPHSVIYTIEDDEKILSANIKYNEATITLTQQAYPDVLIYERLTNSISPYKEMSTRLGTATLGRPKGRQVAVVRTASVLIFATPDRELTESQWRRFFNSIREVDI